MNKTLARNVYRRSDERLVIHVGDEFRRNLITSRYKEQMEKAMLDMFNMNIKLVIFNDEELDAFRNKKNKNTSLDFNPQFSFDNFVVGPSNRFAHGAAIAVTNYPGDVYNPLFIYGR